MYPRPAALLMVFSCCMAVAAPAGGVDSFYCGERLVELDATEQTVIGRCGMPDFSESWEEEFIQKPREEFERSTAIPYAEWIYDSGSNRFIRVLQFRDGVLKNIQVRGYGPGMSGDCNAKSVAVGDTKYEVLRKCGEPASRRHVTEKRTEPVDSLHRRRYGITVERWSYAPKGGHLPRTVVFRNRRVTDIEFGNGS
jgi:hypothetical protein